MLIFCRRKDGPNLQRGKDLTSQSQPTNHRGALMATVGVRNVARFPQRFCFCANLRKCQIWQLQHVSLQIHSQVYCLYILQKNKINIFTISQSVFIFTGATQDGENDLTHSANDEVQLFHSTSKDGGAGIAGQELKRIPKGFATMILHQNSLFSFKYQQAFSS